MISVLIPVYNTPKNFLLECFSSIENQTFQNYEVIIVNNDSDKQETNEVLEIYSRKDKFFVFDCPKQKNKRGISCALNLGLEKCTYEHVARMDSDDRMLPERLQKQISYMFLNPEVDICGTQMFNMNTKKLMTNHQMIIEKEKYKVSDWFLNHPTVMFKKTKILNIGGYPETPEYAPEDFLLWAKALKNDFIIHNMRDSLIYYRIHGENLSGKDQKHADWKKAMEECRK